MSNTNVHQQGRPGDVWSPEFGWVPAGPEYAPEMDQADFDARFNHPNAHTNQMAAVRESARRLSVFAQGQHYQKSVRKWPVSGGQIVAGLAAAYLAGGLTFYGAWGSLTHVIQSKAPTQTVVVTGAAEGNGQAPKP